MNVFFLLLFLPLSAKAVTISGIRSGNASISRVPPNEPFDFVVFGSNLPRDGYYFTTATQCENGRLTNGSVNTVAVKCLRTRCSYAILSVPNGLPFTEISNAYHLCRDNATTDRMDYLRVIKADSHFFLGSQNVIICVVCVLLAAYSSGMTLGYMKFSIVELNRMCNSGDANLAKRARRILRFRRRSNWLVVAFSLFSSICTVMFTSHVEKMLDGVKNESVLKIIIPTLILFVFAEMTPQAICNSKFGFNLASGLWFVSVLIFIVTFPIAYPASRVLGRYLKRNVREVLTQEEKTCMIRNLAKNANDREKTILHNATTFSQKRVEELMVPMEHVFMLSKSQRLNRSTILTIVEKGYTRVPVCDDKNKDTIIGMLNTKDLSLLSCNLSKEPTVGDVLDKVVDRKDSKKRPKFAAKYVNAEMKAQLLLDQMRTGDFHFACVVKHQTFGSRIVGIITIENILEELFGKIDESNQNRKRSSVDDRADNAVIGWCREAGTDKKYPLLFTQQLRVLQHLLKECSVLRKLEVGIPMARQLLSSQRIHRARKGEVLDTEDVLLVIWQGTVRITSKEETFETEVAVAKPPSATDDVQKRAAVPVLIVGKQILNRLSESLCCPFKEEIGDSDQVDELQAVSEEVHFFQLQLEDLLNTINGGIIVKKSESKPAESFLQRLHTPSALTPSPAPSLEKIQVTEKTPLLRSKETE